MWVFVDTVYHRGQQTLFRKGPDDQSVSHCGPDAVSVTPSSPSPPFTTIYKCMNHSEFAEAIRSKELAYKPLLSNQEGSLLSPFSKSFKNHPLCRIADFPVALAACDAARTAVGIVRGMLGARPGPEAADGATAHLCGSNREGTSLPHV